jgi:ribonuclease D
LIYAPAVVKVFHSARQDLEVLFDLRGAVPTPLFDTQIAAALTGPEDQIGYGALVERIAGHKLPKLHTRTDWEARPLSADQLRYAEDDVRYLRDVYLWLDARLGELGRRGWLVEECAALADPALYRNDPEQAWRRLRAGQSLPAPAQRRLTALAAWRERVARERNLPRNWVFKDAVLVDLAAKPPASLDDLAARHDVHAGAVRKWGAAMLDVMARAHDADATPLWDEAVRFDQTEQKLYKEMAARVQTLAATAHLSPTLLATRQDLQDLIRRRDGRLTRGWRRALVGEDLLKLRGAPTPVGA